MRRFAATPEALVPLVALAVSCAAAAAGAAEPFPSPGLYRVDIVGTDGVNAAGMTVESTTRVQGSNGNTTLTQRATGQAPVTAGVHAGNGPVTTCFKPASDPAAAYAMNQASGCHGNTDRPKTDGNSMTFDLQCPTLTQQIQSRRIDERSWELRVTTQSRGATLATAPMATVAAMGPAIAKMEERLRTGPQDAEAAAIRKQLDALRSGGGAPAAGSIHTVVHRYTKLADTCS
jgi:hypothetical protein